VSAQIYLNVAAKAIPYYSSPSLAKSLKLQRLPDLGLPIIKIDPQVWYRPTGLVGLFPNPGGVGEIIAPLKREEL
jgi:hypothetical protein